MKIQKSTRHSKITGDFAEHLTLYWLSKYGFECAKVDHTGIDLIARNPHTKELMGVSVKGRSRKDGRDGEGLLIRNETFPKVDAACKAFACKPYFALVIDEKDIIKVFIMNKETLLKYSPIGKTNITWKMTKVWTEKYAKDKEIMSIEFCHKAINWWK